MEESMISNSSVDSIHSESQMMVVKNGLETFDVRKIFEVLDNNRRAKYADISY